MFLDNVQCWSFFSEILFKKCEKKKKNEISIECYGVAFALVCTLYNILTLITTTEQPQTLRGLPSLSILHRPLHSPNFLFESTRINGIWCSLHNAVINFLYCGSSQLSAKIARTAWRLYGAHDSCASSETAKEKRNTMHYWIFRIPDALRIHVGTVITREMWVFFCHFARFSLTVGAWMLSKCRTASTNSSADMWWHAAASNARFAQPIDIHSTHVRAMGSHLLVKGFACLMDAMHQTVGDQRFLQHFLQCGVDVHRSTEDWGWGSFTAMKEMRAGKLITRLAKSSYFIENRHGTPQNALRSIQVTLSSTKTIGKHLAEMCICIADDHLTKDLYCT